MKNILFLGFSFFFTILCFGQKENDSIYYFNDILIGENSNVNLFAKNIVSKTSFAKFGCVIDNRSNKYVVVFEDKWEFNFGGNSFWPKKPEQGKVVAAFKKEMFTIESKDAANYLMKEFVLKPGGIFTFDPEGSYTEAEPFHLPAKQNKFIAGNFTLILKNIKKETDETIVKFECTYNGEKIAVISPSNAIIKTDDGKEWANAKSDVKPKVLQKGEKTSFILIWQIPGNIVDMQFAEMDIHWKNSFVETEMEELFFSNQTITIDKIKTAEKNKKDK